MSQSHNDESPKNNALWEHAQLGVAVAGLVHGFFLLNQYVFSTYVPTPLNRAAYVAQLLLTSAVLTHAFNLFRKKRHDRGMVSFNHGCYIARSIRFSAATCAFSSVAMGAVYGEQAIQFVSDPSNMFRSLAMAGLMGVVGIVSSSIACREHRRICRNGC